MQIKLTAVATLKKYFGTGYIYKVQDKLTVRDLLIQHDVPLKMIMFVTANKNSVTVDYQIEDGDEIIIYPFISGG